MKYAIILWLTLLAGNQACAGLNLNIQTSLGYFGLPDTLSGSQTYNYWPAYAASEVTAGSSLLIAENNRFKLNIAKMDRLAFSWQYGIDAFLSNHIGLGAMVEYGESLNETEADSDFQIRGSSQSYWSSIPHDYYIETGTRHETLALSFTRVRFKFMYRIPLKENLEFIAALGPALSEVSILYTLDSEEGVRRYYQNNGNEVYSERLYPGSERVNLHLTTLETTPEVEIKWHCLKALDLKAGICLPFATVKTMSIGDGDYDSNNQSITLDHRFWLTNPQFTLGISLSTQGGK